MPLVSQAQRRLMYAAADKKGGVAGVPQSVGKEFTASDKPGKLPEKVGSRSSRMYGSKKAVTNG